MREQIIKIMKRDLMPFPNKQDNLEYTEEDVILIAETFAKEYCNKQLLINGVGNQRELLIAYCKHILDECTDEDKETIDEFLALNSN